MLPRMHLALAMGVLMAVAMDGSPEALSPPQAAPPPSSPPAGMGAMSPHGRLTMLAQRIEPGGRVSRYAFAERRGDVSQVALLFPSLGEIHLLWGEDDATFVSALARHVDGAQLVSDSQLHPRGMRRQVHRLAPHGVMVSDLWRDLPGVLHGVSVSATDETVATRVLERFHATNNAGEFGARAVRDVPLVLPD